MEFKQYLTLIFLLSTSGLAANPVLLPGFEANATSTLGIMESRFGSASYYNPANLTLRNNSQVDFQVIPTYIEYSYAPADPDLSAAGLVELFPTVSLGYARKISENFYFGFSLIPTGIGTKLEVEQVPFQISNQTSIFDVEQSTIGLNLPVGMGFKLSNRLRFGASLLLSYSSNEISALQNGQAIVQGKYSGLNGNLRAGIRWHVLPGKWHLGLVVQPPQQNQLSGNVTLSLGGVSASQSFSPQQSIPLYLGLGTSLFLIGGHTIAINFGLFDHGAGITGLNLNNDDPENDFLLAFASSISYRTKIFETWQLLLGFSYDQSALGEGIVEIDPVIGSKSVVKSGAGSFGDTDSLNRMRLSAGLDFGGEGWNYRIFYALNIGRRQISSDGQNPGRYSMASHQFGLAIAIP